MPAGKPAGISLPEKFSILYTLKQGILEAEAEICENFPGMIEVKSPEPGYYHGEGIEWHKTKESAVQKAKEIRDKKIISLEKQIEKLKDLTF